MHNLALALQLGGHEVSGSDDIIYDPAKTRLKEKSLLPDRFGWFEENISSDLDLIILGMHAKADNPELLKAKKLGIKIHSFPSFIAEYARKKTKVVVAGSHGKTTTTSMIMHCLKANNIDHDYLVGAQLPGYENMVRLSDSDLIIIEGDEYLSSCSDPKPKFLHYTPDLCIITGIAWDHINVFKTFEEYIHQFDLLLETIDPLNKVFIDGTDKELAKLKNRSSNNLLAYFPFENLNGDIIYNDKRYPIKVFGKHNMSNLKAAYNVCKELGIDGDHFFKAMESFEGASKRQQKLVSNKKHEVYWDFAHAPSKVKATVQAFLNKFGHKKLAVIVELHTYSSLNKNFLPHYKNTLEGVHNAAVFFNPANLKIKKMDPLENDFILNSFDRSDIEILKTPNEMHSYLKQLNTNFLGIVLIMSSGQLGGIKIKEIFSI